MKGVQFRSDPTRAYETALVDVPRANAAGVEVLCVALDLSAPLDAPQLAALDESERARAARFLRHEDAVRHAATRAALREALAERLAQPAHALQLERDEAGRPRLAGPLAQALDFNVSHTGQYALIAISATRRVGVDIELRREAFDWRSVARSVFTSAESRYVESLPEASRQAAFYDAWAAKEALLKALGVGIAIAGGMPGFSVLGPEHGEGCTPQVRVGVRVADANADAAHATIHAAEGVERFDAVWCAAPQGYAACVAWSHVVRATAV
ncbi:4'-phosphopantetheinyl transferase superfamily protein [Trinickia sp. LjRoot230]|uniref:4'-phosphopantetheinyl transferase family protein n=1 Tax=Trinickia sp. LjRoot230 TaxID=3342288 RepID=UPI003ED147CB